MDKSYVTITLCPICKEDNGSLLLDRRLKPRFDMHTIDPTQPCDKCKEKYLKKGVMLINPETCSLAVIKVSAFKRMFNVPVPEKHIAFAEEQVIQLITKGGESK